MRTHYIDPYFSLSPLSFIFISMKTALKTFYIDKVVQHQRTSVYVLSSMPTWNSTQTWKKKAVLLRKAAFSLASKAFCSISNIDEYDDQRSNSRVLEGKWPEVTTKTWFNPNKIELNMCWLNMHCSMKCIKSKNRWKKWKYGHCVSKALLITDLWC